MGKKLLQIFLINGNLEIMCIRLEPTPNLNAIGKLIDIIPL
jgi:hypothetical protein